MGTLRGLLAAINDPANSQGLLNFGLNTLAQSGYSATPRTFGEIVANSMLQSQQMAAKAAQEKMQQQMMQAQLAKLQQPEQQRIVEGPDGNKYYENGTPVLPNVRPAPKPIVPLDEASKLTQDFKNGLIDEPTYKSRLSLMTTRQAPVQVNVGDKLPAPPQGQRYIPDPSVPGGMKLINIPGAKLPDSQAIQAIGVKNTREGIASYRNALKDWSIFDAADPNARARMGTIYNNMMLQAKEAYRLGVLNGPDYQILTSIVTDPRSPSAVFVSKKALDDQAKALDSIMERIGKEISQVPGGGGGAAVPGGIDGTPGLESPAAPVPVPGIDAIDAELARRTRGK